MGSGWWQGLAQGALGCLTWRTLTTTGCWTQPFCPASPPNYIMMGAAEYPPTVMLNHTADGVHGYVVEYPECHCTAFKNVGDVNGDGYDDVRFCRNVVLTPFPQSLPVSFNGSDLPVAFHLTPEVTYKRPDQEWADTTVDFNGDSASDFLATFEMSNTTTPLVALTKTPPGNFAHSSPPSYHNTTVALSVVAAVIAAVGLAGAVVWARRPKAQEEGEMTGLQSQV
eukprot:Sspe_Gene.80648::Locus_51021_Transcript_4_5_Confidence_0.273_Length_1095::g.80648::m.80648